MDLGGRNGWSQEMGGGEGERGGRGGGGGGHALVRMCINCRLEAELSLTPGKFLVC